MPVLAPFATNGTKAADDTYIYELYTGTLDTKTNQISWKYPAAGSWTVTGDTPSFAPGSPFLNIDKADTFVFRSVLPANAQFDQYGDLMAPTAQPGMQPLWPGFVGVEVEKSAGNYWLNLDVDFADNTLYSSGKVSATGTPNPRNVYIRGIDIDGGDGIRIENYKSTIVSGAQKTDTLPFESRTFDIDTNAQFSGFVNGLWDVPWYFDRSAEEQGQVNIFVSDVTAMPNGLGGTTSNIDNLFYASIYWPETTYSSTDKRSWAWETAPGALPSDLVSLLNSIPDAEFRTSLQASFLDFGPDDLSRLMSESRLDPNQKDIIARQVAWSDATNSVNELPFTSRGVDPNNILRFDIGWSDAASGINDYLQNLSLAQPYQETYEAELLIADRDWSGLPYSQGDNSLALRGSLAGEDIEYTVFLDPHALSDRTIVFNSGSEGYQSSDHGGDVVSYMRPGFKANGNYGLVSNTYDGLDKFYSGSGGSNLNAWISNNQQFLIANVYSENHQGLTSEHIDQFFGIDGLMLSPGDDSVGIYQTPTPINTGDRNIWIAAGAGVDNVYVATGGSNTLNPARIKQNGNEWSFEKLELQLGTFFEDKQGITANLTDESVTRNGTTTSSYIDLNTNMKTYELVDAAGFKDTLQFSTGAYIPTLEFEGTRFSDRIYITDNGAGGRVGTISTVGSHGSDRIVVSDSGSGGGAFYSDGTYTKPLSIKLDYQGAFDDYISRSGTLGMQVFSNSIFEGALTGVDGFSYGSNIIYDGIDLSLSDRDDYFEYIFGTLRTDDYSVVMGGGRDNVFIRLPWSSEYTFNYTDPETSVSYFSPSEMTQSEEIRQKIFTKDPGSLTSNGDNAFNIYLGWRDADTGGTWTDLASDKVEIDLSAFANILSNETASVYNGFFSKTLDERLQGVVNDINIYSFDDKDQLSLVGLDPERLFINGVDGPSTDASNYFSGGQNLERLFVQTGANSLQFYAAYDTTTNMPATAGTQNRGFKEVLSVNFVGGTPHLPSQLTVQDDRTVQQFAEVAMTDGRDYAILSEDSGLGGPGVGIYNFRSGDDDVTLYEGDIDIALGAGNDYARVIGNGGFQTVIGNQGLDGLSLYGDRDNWSIVTLTPEEASKILATKYGTAEPKLANGAWGDFGIEQDAAGLAVVYLAKYEGGKATWGEDDAGRPIAISYESNNPDMFNQFDQTVMFQMEEIEFSDGKYTETQLVDSYDFGIDMRGGATKTAQTLYGRRETEDSITIYTDQSGVTSALKNVRKWLDTTTVAETKLKDTVLDGSHVNKINSKEIISSIKENNSTLVHNFVDIEKIVVTDGSEANTFTFRIVGSNGYSDIDAAQSSAHFGDVLFIAEKLEQLTDQRNNKGAFVVDSKVATDLATDISVKSGLGVVFEATATAGKVFNVTVQNQHVSDYVDRDPVNTFVLGNRLEVREDTRITFLLGDNDVNVQGSSLDDVIVGNSGKNVIRGGSGDDIIYGGAGQDVLLGQSGDDYIVGSDSDYLNGGSGDDQLLALGSTKKAATTFDTQVVIGGSGDDTVFLMQNNGQVNTFLGSGEDHVVVTEEWINSYKVEYKNQEISKITATATADPIARILDFSTTADTIQSPDVWAVEGDASIQSDLSRVGINIQQLVSPPAPVDGSHEYEGTKNEFGEDITVVANAPTESIDYVSIRTLEFDSGELAAQISDVTVADLIESYRLANAV